MIDEAQAVRSVREAHYFVAGALLGAATSAVFFFATWQNFKDDVGERIERKIPTEAAIAVFQKNGVEMYVSGSAADRFWQDHSVAVGRIDLRNASISDGELNLIRGAREISEMHLDGTQISDEGLQILASLPDLKLLDVRRTPVSKEAVNKFRMQRPDCKLVSDLGDSSDNPVMQEEGSTISKETARSIANKHFGRPDQGGCYIEEHDDYYFIAPPYKRKQDIEAAGVSIDKKTGRLSVGRNDKENGNDKTKRLKKQ